MISAKIQCPGGRLAEQGCVAPENSSSIACSAGCKQLNHLLDFWLSQLLLRQVPEPFRLAGEALHQHAETVKQQYLNDEEQKRKAQAAFKVCCPAAVLPPCAVSCQRVFGLPDCTKLQHAHLLLFRTSETKLQGVSMNVSHCFPQHS